VNFATADGTAVAGADYAGYAGFATVPAGETDVVILVPVFGDTLAEGDETMHVSLTGAVGASISPVSDAVGTILNDDPLPNLAVNDVSVTEGNPGLPHQAVFTVSLSAPSGQTVSVSYATQQGSATVTEDFIYTSGTLALGPGSTSATVSVPIVPDLQVEGDETFSLLLFSPSNATVSDGIGTAYVIDDESSMSFYTVTPCRLFDTRQTGPALGANTVRTFDAGGVCGIPLTARAVTVNITSVAPHTRGTSDCTRRLRRHLPRASSISVAVKHARGTRSLVSARARPSLCSATCRSVRAAPPTWSWTCSATSSRDRGGLCRGSSAHS
jgi:hypothetical protein